MPSRMVCRGRHWRWWLINHQKICHYVRFPGVFSSCEWKSDYSHRDNRISYKTVNRIGGGSEVDVPWTHPLEHLVVQDVNWAPVIHQYPVDIVVGHHCFNDQGVTMGVMDEVCIILFESDVIILPLVLLCRSLVHTSRTYHSWAPGFSPAWGPPKMIQISCGGSTSGASFCGMALLPLM